MLGVKLLSCLIIYYYIVWTKIFKILIKKRNKLFENMRNTSLKS